MMQAKAKQEDKRAYREQPKSAGVFQVKNTINGRVLLGSSLNLHGPLNAHRFMLKMGSHTNKLLQQEWNSYGLSTGKPPFAMSAIWQNAVERGPVQHAPTCVRRGASYRRQRRIKKGCCFSGSLL